MKKARILLVITMLITLSACGSTKPEASSDKEVLRDALQQFEKLDSVEVSNKGEGTMVGFDHGTIVTFPFDYENPLKTYEKDKESLLTRSITKDGIYITKENKEKRFSIDFTYEEMMVQNGLIKSGLITRIFEYNSDETTLSDSINILEVYKKYLNDDFKDCISIASKNNKDNKVISINIKDVDLFNEKRLEAMKVEDPDYDPLVYTAPGSDTKILLKKNEQTTLNIDFTIDSNNNILQVKHHDIIDYGDTYVTNTTQTSNFKKFNNAKLDKQEINELFEKATNGELTEGTTVNFKNIPAV